MATVVGPGAGGAGGRQRAARRHRAVPAPARPEVSVVVPTFNEAENLPLLLERLAGVLDGLAYEVVVVDDDSPDGTWLVGQRAAQADARIRVIRRVGERGLSSAVVAGMQASTGRAVAVLDADLQHDEAILPTMVAAVLGGGADVAVGSRDAAGGSYGEFSPGRRAISWGGAVLARRLLGLDVSDVMSGYFVVSRRRIDEVAPLLNPRGFKILLELLARGPRPRVVEVGYRFRQRRHGATKLTGSVLASYLLALSTLVAGRWLSTTLAAYTLVGLVGVAVRSAAHVSLAALGVGAAGAIAFQASVASNYWLNNRFTFATCRRHGPALARGALLFQLVSLHGLLVQVGVHHVLGGLAGGTGRLPAPVAAAALAASFWAATVSNYALNRAVTWRTSGG